MAAQGGHPHWGAPTGGGNCAPEGPERGLFGWGLLAACEPRPRGPQADPGAEAERLKKEVARLDRDLKRQQALTRATQRAIGLVAPAAKPDKKEGKGKAHRRRKPTVRGLRAAEHLKAQVPAEAATSSQEG